MATANRRGSKKSSPKEKGVSSKRLFYEDTITALLVTPNYEENDTEKEILLPFRFTKPSFFNNENDPYLSASPIDEFLSI